MSEVRYISNGGTGGAEATGRSVAVTTLSCGCEIRVCLCGCDNDPEMVECALHAAAGDLKVALEGLLLTAPYKPRSIYYAQYREAQAMANRALALAGGKAQ